MKESLYMLNGNCVEFRVHVCFEHTKLICDHLNASAPWMVVLLVDICSVLLKL